MKKEHLLTIYALLNFLNHSSSPLNSNCMKCILIFILLFVIVTPLTAQSDIDTTIKIDLLKAPVSPASNLLGIAPSDVDKPTDVSAFMLSLQAATNAFTKLPANYAVDIAPYWLFKNSKKGDITTEGFKKSKGPDVFKQTLILSFAVKNPDSTETGFNSKSIYGGFGIKFSILRGHYDEETNQALKKIKTFQDIKLKHLDSLMTEYKANTDPDVARLRKERKDLFKGINVNDKSPENQAKVQGIFASADFRKITDTLNQILTFTETDSADAIQNVDKQIQLVAAAFQTNRIGLTWDINAGISGEFVNKRFDNSKVHNAGIWINLGYTTNKGHSFLFLIRYLYNPDQIFAKENAINDIGNISTLDGGFKYAYSQSQSKFNCSIETIYRSVLSSDTIDPSWRLIVNADYAIWQNQKLTFSFGRNFDGTITKDGNLIAALTFLTGFGNKR